MKHFNKNTNTNASDVGEYIEGLRITEKKGKSKNVQDLIILSILIFGIFGFYRASQGIFSNKSNENSISKIGGINENSTKEFPQNPNQTQKTKTVVSIDGNLETDEKITFFIKGYDPTLVYILDFGDGKTEEIKNRKVTYSYSRAGFFEVQLLVNYSGDVLKLFTEELNIAAAPKMKPEFIDEVEY